MNKTTRLNKIQKYAINWLHSTGNKTQEISKELKIKHELIEKYVEKNLEAKPTVFSKTNKKECVARFGEDKKESKTLNMMVTETAGKRTKSVCIMTKEASSLSDKR